MIQEEFQSQIERHKKILYKVCNAYCKDRDGREDLAQEILFQLWRSYGKFDGRCQYSTWMYRIALNVAISFYRSESARGRLVVADEERVLAAVDPGGAEPEEVRLLYAFIGGLDPLHKALMLLYLDGFSYGEIAATLGISETNVATKMSRMKLRMKGELWNLTR